MSEGYWRNHNVTLNPLTSGGEGTVHLAKCAVAGTLVLIMVLSTTMISLSASGAKVTYEYYIIGDPDDSDATPSPGLLLAGGSTDVAEAMEWMIEKSGGGDFVVLRCAGTDAYNPWIYKQLAEPGELDSCETIIFLEPESCEDPILIKRIVNAEALFIAGGDQWNYVSMWEGTSVEAAIHSVRDRGAPIGGTSAGLAILGEFVFSAENDTIDSDDALRNPYNRRVCLEKEFLDMPNMGGKITDSHFVARDRMGRLVTFLARIVQDGWATEARGIGIDEKTALGIRPGRHRHAVRCLQGRHRCRVLPRDVCSSEDLHAKGSADHRGHLGVQDVGHRDV